MVEFTLSLSVLIPMFLGGASFGYTFYLYSKLQNAVRAGARYASTIKYDSSTTTPTTSFLTAVQKMTVYGDPAADASTATAVAPGLTTGNVNLVVTFSSGTPSGMTVSISGYSLPVTTGKVTLSGKPYAWFPFAGFYGPP